MNPKLLWAGLLLGIEVILRPDLKILTAVFIVVAIDLITGIIKAKIKGVARTSEGYRRTVSKCVQYFVAILVLYGASKIIPEQANTLKQASSYICLFVIYIEITSIFENLYEMDQLSSFSKFFIRPVLTVLKFGIEKNPIAAAAEKFTKDNEKPVS